VPGYHLAVQSQDDRAHPATGAAAAATLARDPSLVGVLGPFNSSVAQAVQPVLGETGVVQISPSSSTSIGPPPETVPAARDFVEAYRRAGYPESFGSYGASTFDAANVLVDSAVRTLGEEGEWTPALRPAMVRLVQGFHGDGITGPVSFDRFGDVSTDAVTVYRVQGRQWAVVGLAD
jgi:branched-chain amino acid transport system substrate-binding protein